MLIPTSLPQGSRADNGQSHPLNLWVYHDDRAGHINQLKALIQALASQAQVNTRWIPVQSASFNLKRTLKPKRLEDSPDIVIGAGHATHKHLILSARAHQARSFVIMKPSFPLRLFDGVICPEHDGLAASKFILNTHGPLSLALPAANTEAAPSKRSRHLMLIGGISKHYDWNDSSLVQQVKTICLSNPDINWLLTDSPRTPNSFLENLDKGKPTNLTCYRYDDDQLAELSSLLAESAFTWVTPDSMSMIYESLTSGSPTALFDFKPSPKGKRRKLCRHIEKLIASGPVIGFKQWQTRNTNDYYPAPPPPLNEAEKAATWLLKRYQALKESK